MARRKAGVDLQAWVAQVVENEGGRARTDGDTLLVTLTDAMARDLGVPRKLRLAFAPVEGAPDGTGDGKPAVTSEKMPERLGDGKPDGVPGRTPDAPEKKEPAAEYVAVGHPLIDHLMTRVSARGETTQLLLKAMLDVDLLDEISRFDPVSVSDGRRGADGAGSPVIPAPGPDPGPLSGPDTGPVPPGPVSPWRAWERLVAQCAGLRFGNSRARLLHTRIVYRTEALFLFRVTLGAEDREERLVALMVDPEGEEVMRLVDIEGAVGFHGVDDEEQASREYRLRRLYDQAVSRLETRIRRAALALKERADERRRKEVRRINEYYDGLMKEQLEPLRRVFRQMAVATVRADLSRSGERQKESLRHLEALRAESQRLERAYERGLAELTEEREQRLREVRERYGLGATVSLRQVALVLCPRVEWRLALFGPAEATHTLQYDWVRRQIVPWACDGCQRPVRDQLLVCGCEAVVCRDCLRTCGACDAPFCRACAAANCHLCRAPVCPRCSPTCPVSAVDPSPRPAPVCVECRERVCPDCVALAAFQWEDAR